MKTTDRMLLGNKSWAQERRDEDVGFFQRLSREQKPDVLWIGCSDSRVPANQVTDTDAGEIFVHRNIANLVHASDLNLASVLQYGIGVLGVKHVIVCGHSGCGGVKASMSDLPEGPVGVWLSPVRSLYEQHGAELAALSEVERANRLCELNVRAQVAALARSPIVQEAWQRGGGPSLHGWVYALTDGLLKQLVSVAAPE